MPELPEVETVRRGLEKEIKGKTIKQAIVKVPKLANLPKKKFEAQIRSKRVEKVKRRAKLLIIKLSGGWNLMIHLKMTGQLVYRKDNKIKKGGHPFPLVIDPRSLPNKYSHVIFHFKDGSSLFFNDQRKFGYIKLLKDKELEKALEKFSFGPEILDPKFTLSKFAGLLNDRPRSAIKPLLMDQSFIAGIGNIYAQEACFYAKVDPRRPAGSLSPKEVKDLYEGLKKVLKLSIEKQGTSAENYVDVYGRQGGYIKFLKVYGRQGEKCYRCGNTLKQAKVGGRGTVFCPKCQK